jgi:hypothetical protein
MNPTLAIEQLSGALVQNQTPTILSVKQTTLEAEAGPTKTAFPIWSSYWKSEEHFEAFMTILSVIYLIGAISFGGLLLFYALSR